MDKRKVWIMSGIPGSGKTSYLPRLGYGKFGHVLYYHDYQIVSADQFFTDAEGKYNFDVTKLSQAHNDCLFKYMNYIQNLEADIIVDNTNIRMYEIAPYYRLAEVFDCDVTIVRLLCSPEVAAVRCTHGVPPAKIREMAQSFDPLPPWWKIETYWTGN